MSSTTVVRYEKEELEKWIKTFNGLAAAADEKLKSSPLVGANSLQEFIEKSASASSGGEIPPVYKDFTDATDYALTHTTKQLEQVSENFREIARAIKQMLEAYERQEDTNAASINAVIPADSPMGRLFPVGTTYRQAATGDDPSTKVFDVKHKDGSLTPAQQREKDRIAEAIDPDGARDVGETPTL